MSKLHIGSNVNSDTWNVVIHNPTPVGNNNAGCSWQDVLVNSGVGGTTVLNEGSGAGQISTVEKAAVEAGTVIEMATQLTVQPPYALSDWNVAVNEAWTKHATELKRQLNWYGRVEG